MKVYSHQHSEYQLHHSTYGDYDIFALEELHILFVFHAATDLIYYLPLTRSEYLILSRLLQVPHQETIPFLDLLPAESQERVLPLYHSALQRHIYRLKKKLPSGWRIACEPGFGYRLCVPVFPGGSADSRPAYAPTLLFQKSMDRSNLQRGGKA
jgi:DNA-binding response OmpR family regulator